MPSDGQGYGVLHNGQLITVFSASNYCGCFDNLGGVVIFSEPGVYQFKEYLAPSLADIGKVLEPKIVPRKRKNSIPVHVSREPEEVNPQQVIPSARAGVAPGGGGDPSRLALNHVRIRVVGTFFVWAKFFLPHFRHTYSRVLWSFHSYHFFPVLQISCRSLP